MIRSSRPIRWGILGTARVASKVCRAMKCVADCEAVAVASRVLGRATAWAKEHGVRRAYGTYAELLDDAEVDAVYIPLPNSMHQEWTIRAAERGKHVLCEKPLGRNYGEATHMAQACLEHGVQLMDGSMWLHHPRTEEMLRVVRDKTFGHPRRIAASHSFHLVSECSNSNIRLDPSLAGGSLLDLGWYCITAALLVVDCLPERVIGLSVAHDGVDIVTSAMLLFPDECVASLDCGFETTWRQRLEIAGQSQSVECDDFVLPWSSDEASYRIVNDRGERHTHTIKSEPQEVLMIRHFSQAVRDSASNPAMLQRSLHVQRLCDAILKSARERCAVAIG